MISIVWTPKNKSAWQFQLLSCQQYKQPSMERMIVFIVISKEDVHEKCLCSEVKLHPPLYSLQSPTLRGNVTKKADGHKFLKMDPRLQAHAVDRVYDMLPKKGLALLLPIHNSKNYAQLSSVIEK
ncbi:hypothetical protein LWI28_007376 [Acer negundo]|uniref:Uncharacterized protein n=1 Tax=Acer negundo TaxID=4023 RepID=A0AAD5ICK0_ACENE|nr:hypothetical protein LWI28_007376 [Acer negundo]